MGGPVAKRCLLCSGVGALGRPLRPLSHAGNEIPLSSTIQKKIYHYFPRPRSPGPRPLSSPAFRAFIPFVVFIRFSSAFRSLSCAAISWPPVGETFLTCLPADGRTRAGRRGPAEATRRRTRRGDAAAGTETSSGGDPTTTPRPRRRGRPAVVCGVGVVLLDGRGREPGPANGPLDGLSAESKKASGCVLLMDSRQRVKTVFRSGARSARQMRASSSSPRRARPRATR